MLQSPRILKSMKESTADLNDGWSLLTYTIKPFSPQAGSERSAPQTHVSLLSILVCGQRDNVGVGSKLVSRGQNLPAT